MRNKIFIYLSTLLIFTSFAFAQSIEGKITKITGDKVEINLGTLDGIIKDTMLEIYKKSKLVHPVTGEEIRVQKERVGIVRIDAAEYEKSEGTLVSYQSTPVVGDLVEVFLGKYEYTLNNKDVSGKGMVKDAGTTQAIINLGSNHNVEDGLIFDVYRGGETVNPQTGDKIPAKPVKVGKLIVTTVRPEDSYCKILEGDVKIGDNVELSDKQQDDIDLQRRMLGDQSEPVQQVTKDTGIGRIYKIDADGIHISFDNLYNLQEGDILTVYRNEKLVHPRTNKFLGEQLIKVGQISISSVDRREGIAHVLSSDADIKVADVVKVHRLVDRQPLTMTEKHDEIPDDETKKLEAVNLTKEILSIQKEIGDLKIMAYKVDQIERGLRDQRRVTAQLQNDVQEIKDLIKYGTIERKGPDEGAELDVAGTPGAKENTFRIKYTDDINLRFQLKDKTLTVGLDPDTAKFEGMDYTGMDTTGGMITAESGGAFYKNWFFWAIAALVELGAIAFLVLTIRKKKGAAPAGEDEEFEEEEEEETLEEEGDDLLGEDEEEEIGEPEEEEEEIEDIEELGDEEEAVLDDEAL